MDPWNGPGKPVILGRFEPHEWLIEAEDSLPFWKVRVRRITEKEIRYHTTRKDKAEPINKSRTNYNIKPEFKRARNVGTDSIYEFKPEFKECKGKSRFPDNGFPKILDEVDLISTYQMKPEEITRGFFYKLPNRVSSKRYQVLLEMNTKPILVCHGVGRTPRIAKRKAMINASEALSLKDWKKKDPVLPKEARYGEAQPPILIDLTKDDPPEEPIGGARQEGAAAHEDVIDIKEEEMSSYPEVFDLRDDQYGIWGWSIRAHSPHGEIHELIH